MALGCGAPRGKPSCGAGIPGGDRQDGEGAHLRAFPARILQPRLRRKGHGLRRVAPPDGRSRRLTGYDHAHARGCPGISGGISNVANLVIELAEERPEYAAQIIADAPLFPDVATRRLGWLFDVFGDGAPDELVAYCTALASEPSFLVPSSPRTGRLDAKWGIVANEEVDPDI